MITPLLTLFTDRARALMSLPELAREAVAGGVDIVQVREPDLTQRALKRLVMNVVEAVGVERVAVNNAPRLAAELGVHLHLPERSIDRFQRPQGVRSLTCSVHGLDSLSKVPAGVDVLVAGHVFSTPSHPGLPPLGIDGLRSIVSASSPPVIAIGGVTAENVVDVISAGASGVAVISYVNSSTAPEQAARRLRDALERAMNQQRTTVGLQVNGKPLSVEPTTTLTMFLEARNLHPRLVVVERNREIVAKAAYDSTVLEEGDLLEIAHFVGGG